MHDPAAQPPGEVQPYIHVAELHHHTAEAQHHTSEPQHHTAVPQHHTAGPLQDTAVSAAPFREHEVGDVRPSAEHVATVSTVVEPLERPSVDIIEPAAVASVAAVALAPADDLRLTSPGIRLAQIKDEFVAWIKTLMSAAVYAVLIVTFGFQVARVEGQSMAPTLEDQDRLIVNKLVYRIGEPRRGDIVMLYYPLNPDKSFVKRVIAEEGDTVRIVDGRVYVNDIPLKDDYVASEYRSHDDWGPQVIPEGYYFVMGDHRNNSSDSRHWGMVPKKYIIGKVQLRWWPVPTARVF
ncbi:MAG TPA: signal peptidase I [Vicinamibacterales bacterium]|nr:signal peptidase I [Vicinamibacterales bacterium]